MRSEGSLHSIRFGRAGRRITMNLTEPSSVEPSLAVQLARGGTLTMSKRE